MFALDIYAAILTSRSHTDVMAVFEFEAQAIAQCRAWVATSPKCVEVPVAGFVLWLQYGTKQDTVRAQQLLLALADPADDDALDPEPPHLVTRVELLQRQQEARAQGEQQGEEN